MRKLNTLTSGALIVLVIFAVLAFNVTKSSLASMAENHSVEIVVAKEEVSSAASKRYRVQQQKLNIALTYYFEQAIKAGDVLGAGVSIVQGDSIIFSDGFGKRDKNEKTKVDGETVFRLGSLSKGFSGVLAVKLQEEGKLNIDDKLIEYLPEFQFGSNGNTQKIKFSHILSHASGAPYHSFTNLIEEGFSITNIASRFKKVTPVVEPGRIYSYQNAMFALGQEVMRKATGEDVKTLLKNRFFEPLNMSHISMDNQTLLEETNIALPHVRYRKGWRTLRLSDRYYEAVTAGGINASASDMGKWLRFLLGGNPEVVAPQTIKKVFEPQIKIGRNNKYYQRWANHKQSHYGFGWRIHEFQKTDSSTVDTVWHHGGSVNSYRNEIAIFPKDDLGICVLLNSNSSIARTIIPDLYKLVQKVFENEGDVQERI